MRTMGDLPHAFRDFRKPAQSQEACREVPNGSHDLWTLSGANPAAIFIKRHVAHIVRLILNSPMAAMELQQTRSCRSLWPKARDPEGDLGRCGLLLEDGHRLGDAKYLVCVRESQIPIQRGTRLNPPDLQPTVLLVDRLVHRGKKTLPPDARYP